MIMKRKAARSTPAAKTKLPVVLHQSSRPATSMQGVARGSLAERFHQNWLARHSGDPLVTSGPVDDSLTSLSWLQNLNIMKMAAPTPPSSPSPALDSRSYSKPPAPCPVSAPPIQPPKVEPRLSFAEPNPTAVCGLGVGMDNVNYKTNPYVKPPFSYATLICMAMKETKKNKITLSAIYNWITENFMYYRMADPSWQNSIRHNLSLNKCFEKVPRRKDEPGKGGFWRINPEYTNLIENGIFKRRRGSRDSCPAPAPKRIKKEDETIAAVNSIRPNMSRGEDKLLSNGSVVHFGASYDDDDSHALKGDFNWTSILNQDIEINGHPIKTEELLDSSSEDTSPLISSLSPPSSETNSEDLGLDDLFTPVGLSSDVALDFTTHEALDLTVTGHHIPTPGWWSDNPLNLAEEFQALQDITNDQSSGLNTPVPPSPSSLTDDALWSDSHFNTSDDVAHAFDVDNLFDIDNIPSPHIS